MMQGQREQHTILAGDELHFGGRVELRDNIAVTQRHSLRRTGRSRRVKKNRFVVAADRWKFRFLSFYKSLPTSIVVLASVDQDELWPFFEIEFLDPIHSLSCRDDRARVAVLQRVTQNLVAKLDIQGHSDHPCANDSQHSRDRFRAVFRENRNGVAALEIVLNEPISERECASRQFLKRPMISIFLAKDHQCRLPAVLA